ncbi:MAG: type III-B CRISPR-associated protein Cas10/Cmr2 [Methylococcales bacterium]|nr:type III-B CRISPR-associated protein Cas10/Cmr2 [Methylococcales bacterium]
MTIQYFHFSLAPVQGFIAQARRTRDFWAGSFILSWLSAVAMQAVKKQGGCEIIFPKPDDDFLLWLEGKGKNPAPEHGSVPNRFKASVNEGFDPQAVVYAVNTAWKALADKVYEGDLNAINNDKTKEIWDRQVKYYWELSWVISDDSKDSSALDVRKNWRSYLPPEEAGVKCMMMDGWQELSGVPKPNADELTAFWKKIRKGKTGIKSDLRVNEHLCAIAFIKRRFVRYFDQVNQPMTGWTLKGWKVEAGRPSVAYMAAVHWLENVLVQAQHYSDVETQIWRFHDAAIKLTEGNYNEWGNQIACIKICDTSHKWKALDGNVFFESALENANIYDDQEQAGLVLKELKTLQKLVTQEKPDIQSATPFYAVLMMDGDSLGKQMSDTDKEPAITKGLGDFTASVPDLVKKHNGFLIYAGGDDVLAILPLEDALSCALAIRDKYTSIFVGLNGLVTEEAKKISTSISAAVVFAHIKMPLTKVLKNAHELLDTVAKETYGRDALAVRVWKSGNQILEWARPWDCAIEDGQLVLERLAEKFASDDEDGQLSNKFLYKIRERFELLNPPSNKDKKPSDDTETFSLSADQAVELMAAEYFSSGLCDKNYKPSQRMEHAQAVVRPLLEQCRPIYRDDQKPKSPDDWRRDDKVFVDAALLVRFLAQKGVNV